MGKAWDGVEGFDRTTLEGVVSASCLSGVLKRVFSVAKLYRATTSRYQTGDDITVH
jgi:hypothetical protein